MYTKGKWKVTLGGVDLPEHQRIIQSELGRENGIMNVRTICKTFDYGDPEEMIANAHLIAAAPDMYETLKLLLERFDAMEKKYSYPMVLDLPRVWAERATAKAEGKQCPTQ